MNNKLTAEELDRIFEPHGLKATIVSDIPLTHIEEVIRDIDYRETALPEERIALHRAITERDEVIYRLALLAMLGCRLDHTWVTAIVRCEKPWNPAYLSEVIKLALTLRKAEEAGDVKS
jgi:hypothetical protein